MEPDVALVLIIGQLAVALVTFLGVVGSALISWQNSKYINEVRHATNSMKDELVHEVREASLAKGFQQGQDKAAVDAGIAAGVERNK